MIGRRDERVARRGPGAPETPRTRPVFADWKEQRLLAHQTTVSRHAPPEPVDETPARRRAALAVAGLVLLGAACALVAAQAPWPRLRSWVEETVVLQVISVEGASARVPSAEIAETTGLAYGTPLLAVDPAAAEARLLAHPWVTGARVMRLPPGRVLVSVSLREAVAWTRRDATVPPVLVDATGLAFAPVRESDLASLPQLVPSVVATPDGQPASLAEGAELARALARASLGAGAEVHLGAPGDPEGLWLRFPYLPGRIVLGAGDFDAKLARLQRLLAAGLPASETASAIDLRFADRAVLRSQPAPEGAAQSAAAPGGAPPPRGRAG